jgi:hypothetical protein
MAMPDPRLNSLIDKAVTIAPGGKRIHAMRDICQ